MTERARYAGVGPDTFEFLADIRENNTRDWFEQNRARYETSWKTAGLDLIDALADPMSQLDPPLKAEARINGSLRRINRDVRFSKDKSPYQARMHLVFWTGGHPNRSPGIHIVLSPEGLGFGVGTFGLTPAQITDFRTRILNPKDRARLLEAAKSARQTGSEWTEPDLKKLPRGYEADGDWEHLLRRKAFVMRTHADPVMPAWITTQDCAAELMALTEKMMPFLGWLSR